jgi:hypothetical protein
MKSSEQHSCQLPVTGWNFCSAQGEIAAQADFATITGLCASGFMLICWLGEN